MSGGSSRRFGSDKTLALLEGRPLIEHAVSAMNQVSSSIYISVGASSQAYDIEAVLVMDAWEQAGPLSGIASAMKICQPGRIVVLAADLPRIKATTLARLLDHRGSEITVARDAASHRLQPLCAVWNTNLLTDLSAYLDAGKRSVLGFLDTRQVQSQDVDPAELLNINRPEDLTEIQS